MDAVFRVFLAVLLGAIVAMGVPREIGREYRWAVAWEHLLKPGEVDAPEEISDSPATFFPVETDHRFYLIDSDTGTAVAGGFKTDVFLASPEAMINQAVDAPRWAVQSWDGRMLRVVSRRGNPRLHGNTLLQFGPGSTVYGDIVTSGTRWEAELPKNPTVYHLGRAAGGSDRLAVGTLEGTILVVDGDGDGDGGEAWRSTLAFDPDTATTPAIYAVHVAPAAQSAIATSHPPTVHLVHGRNPQSVARLEFDESGGAAHVRIGEIPDRFAGNGPRTILQLGQELLVVGLNEAIFVARPQGESGATVAVEGLTDLSGVGRAGDRVVVVTGTGTVGPLIMAGPPDMTEIAHWELAERSAIARVTGDTLSASTVVVQREDRLVGLKISI